MSPFSLAIGIVAALGAISPLLTFARLFQQKEWRLDRLVEHGRREGWLNQLLGKSRTVIIGLYIALFSVGIALSRESKNIDSLRLIGWMTVIAMLALCAFACLSLLQIAAKKQPMPVWTLKARLIVAASFMLSTTLICTFLADSALLLVPFIIALQPILVLLTTLLLWPVDTMLKKRVMKKAAAVRSAFKEATVIAIAGSVGKTTTKELIAHLLQDLSPYVTPAHVNTEIGVSQWLISQQSIVDSHQVLIVEMGAYRKGEIKLLCDIVQPTIGVMTALGSDHLALFGSEEAILEANAELLEALPKDGHAFLNIDSDGVRKIQNKAPCPVTRTGARDDADVRASAAEETATGIAAILTLQTASCKLQTPLHGLHNIQNILLAVAVAQHMDIANDRIAELLQTFKAPDHTFNVRTQSGITILDDTYNISPLSFKAALNWASMQEGSPKVLLTSGLLETGNSEETFLMELGEAASAMIDRAIFTTKRGKDTFQKAFGKDVELLNPDTEKVLAGGVLICVGRMPQSTIERLLPQAD